jgi:hypothetical protein
MVAASAGAAADASGIALDGARQPETETTTMVAERIAFFTARVPLDG